jgi:hypothetical protein
MKTRRIFWVLTLAAVAIISTAIGRGQSSSAQSGGILDVSERARQAQARQLEGSWILTVTPVTPPGRPSRINYTTFVRGGVSIGSDRLAPFGGAQHGAWEHRGGKEYAWTFISDGSDAMGNYTTTLKVTSKITMTGPNSFVGVNSSELRDAVGNVLFRGCNTFRGERIRVESLREDCQGITPPQ